MTFSNPRQLQLWIWLSLPIIFGAAAAAGELRAEEAQGIEALIAAVGRMTDAVFIRNGQAYDSAVAAEFLRRKWQMKAAHIFSAEDFIEKVASISSTSGRPYLIRLGDGREIPCSVFLRAELAKFQRTRQSTKFDWGGIER
jgi:hypothetical protein